MKKALRYLAIAILPLALSSCSTGGGWTAEDCAENGTMHSGGKPSEDLRNGFVGTERWADFPNEGARSYFEVTNCESENLIRLFRSRRGYEGEADIDKDAEVTQLKARLVSEGVTSRREVAVMAREAGIAFSTSRMKADLQSCGCAVFYPELQGDKRAYDPEATWLDLPEP